MDWSRGFSALYYATVIDPATWRDVSRFELISGSIKHSDDELLEAADIDCKGYDASREKWIRIYLDAKQDGGSVHVPLFTGLATSPNRSINGQIETTSLQCFSVLQPAKDILLPRGWYAPVDTPGADIIKRLLSIGPAPVYIANDSPKLEQAIIAENGENNLSMAQKIIAAINWRIRINGNGEIFIEPVNNNPVSIFDPIYNDVLETGLSIENDWYSCPNVFRAVVDDVYATAIDDNPDSALSTVNRGREIYMEETDCYLMENETPAEYALRRLKEEQKVLATVSYTRRFIPDINCGDVVALHFPQQGLNGNFIITSQDISLEYGAAVSEEVMTVI